MPVTVSLYDQVSEVDFIDMLDALHHGIVSSAENDATRFQRLLKLTDEQFYVHSYYPNLSFPRTKNFLLKDILINLEKGNMVKSNISSSIIKSLSANQLGQIRRQ